MIFLVPFLVALLSVLLISPQVKQLGFRLGIVDQPDARKLHHKAMVRMGGVAIAIGATSAIVLDLAIPMFSANMPLTLPTLAVLVTGLGFFSIGLADDRWSLSPKLRLGLQAIVTYAAWRMGLQMDYLPVPGVGTMDLGWMSLPITFLWVAGITNAINWLDGLDGLATGVSVISALTFALLGWQQGNDAIVILSLALAGAALGFLRYNAMPAQMYMGDGGSYFIGGTLAGIGILSIGSSAEFSTNAMPYINLAIPIIDMVLVILSRCLDGKSPFFPDQRHIHHRLLRLGLAKQYAVLVIYGFTIWAGATAYCLTQNPGWGWSNVILLAVTIALFNRTALASTTPLISTPSSDTIPSEA
jgi:UDP-GlcNAc:undecaprenyl-phosphate/decaprenyl-phosphate GlcNAc-1-phosphate transferase